MGRWRPVRPCQDLGPALDLGVELASGDDPLLLVTDDPGIAVPARCRRVAVGQGRPNAALIGARRIRVGAGEALSVDVAAFGALTTSELRVAARRGDGEQELARRALEFPASGTCRVLVPMADAGTTLHLSLPPDALPLDDELELLPEPPRPVAVAVLLPPATRQLLALERALAAVPGVVLVSQPDAARLLFTPAPGRLLPWTTEVGRPSRAGRRRH